MPRRKRTPPSNHQPFTLEDAGVRVCEARMLGYPDAAIARERAVTGQETGLFIVLLTPGDPLTKADHRRLPSYNRGDPFHGVRIR